MNASRKKIKNTTGSTKKDKIGCLSLPPYNFFDGISETASSSSTSSSSSLSLNLLDATANLLRGRTNIVVLCGAGISVSCGIPDFRSKGGIYDTIDTNDYGLCSPEEIFHYEIFQDNPRLFYKFASTMLCPDKPHEPSPAHKFLSLLHDKKMLLRVYTQNVDGLEEKAGLPSKKVVFAHGSLHTSKCLKCGAKYDTESYRHDIWRGNVPSCRRIMNQRMKRQRNESQSHHDDECGNDKNKINDITVTTCGGVVKPNITFFGEPLDDRVSKCLEVDREKADAVIVMGTSLSVAPISKIVDFLRPSIPRILINRTIVIPKHTDRADSKDIINNVNDDNHHANDDDGVHAKEADFRKGYLFDALLLGFCDDITSALSHVLWGKRDEHHEQFSRSDSHGDTLLLHLPDCKLLANDTAQINELGTSCLLKHPPERILMFPGATWKAHCNDGDEEKVKEEKEKECYH